ncbi:hypothetical protein [Salipiger sp. PrR002]|uniref:hypothetical protein n=1 Tax=Salipiger sp. PrR002 TaxID=2706489 RepID=UPI0013BCDB59|nr:hypothetical protein [Salipiger sp. PrR002]NDW00605.1 hypothetical protein [Salipiger sp. PrR002]NDW57566.1 hypothetical protein [Salipiger sp. PrR004]
MRHILPAVFLIVLFASLPEAVYAPLRSASSKVSATGPASAFSTRNRESQTWTISPATAQTGRALYHGSARLLVGPGDLSPGDFGAFGVIAFARGPQFPKDSSDPEAARAAMICRAFVASLSTPERTQPERPSSERVVVTVWPMQSSAAAERARQAPPGETCAIALQRYRFETADLAIGAAVDSGQLNPSRRGPFLMAWQPGASFADPGRPILFDDLSNVNDPEEAQARLARWDRDIADEERYGDVLADRLGLWAYLRLRLRTWADTQGARLLPALRAALMSGWQQDA